MEIHFPRSVESRVSALLSGVRRLTGRTLFQRYVTTAVVLLDIIVLLIAANLVLGIVYALRDARASRNEATAALNVAAAPRFNPDGSPVSTAKRNEYQMAWIDFQAVESDPAYVADVLDDFYDLGKAGMTYQPSVSLLNRRSRASESLLNRTLEDS